jgi:pantothenate synthetase
MENIIKSGNPSQIDYVVFINPEIFTVVEKFEPPEVLAAVAVRFGTTRLIDNWRIQVH